jgi:regulator of replication initiation timing
MKSLTTITGNLDDMDQTVLSVEELAHLVNDLAALRLENKRLQEQLEAIGAGGVEPLRARKSPAEDEHDRLAKRAAAGQTDRKEPA